MTGSTGARAFERDLEDDPQPPLVHFSLRASNCLLRTEYAGVSGCRCEFPGVSGCRCEGGGTGTPELPGPVLREGKLETGLVPTAKRPRPGSSTDTSKCSCTHSPSLQALACPAASGPDSSCLEEREPLSVHGSWVTATGHSVRTPGWGPKVVVEWWAPSALTPLPARSLSTTRGLPLFLWALPGPGRVGSRV